MNYDIKALNEKIAKANKAIQAVAVQKKVLEAQLETLRKDYKQLTGNDLPTAVDEIAKLASELETKIANEYTKLNDAADAVLAGDFGKANSLAGTSAQNEITFGDDNSINVAQSTSQDDAGAEQVEINQVQVENNQIQSEVKPAQDDALLETLPVDNITINTPIQANTPEVTEQPQVNRVAEPVIEINNLNISQNPVETEVATEGLPELKLDLNLTKPEQPAEQPAPQPVSQAQVATPVNKAPTPLNINLQLANNNQLNFDTTNNSLLANMMAASHTNTLDADDNDDLTLELPNVNA